MKPPPRKRIKKSSELPPVPQPQGRTVCNWPKAEKKRLLSALSQMCTREQLDPERVREHLPKRTTEEMKWVLEALKEKVVLFAKAKYLEERREEQRVSKPLDIWIQEATAVTGTMEDVLSSAFNQILSVTAIEPHPQYRILAQPRSQASSASPQLSRSQPQSAAVTPPTQSPLVTEERKTTTTAQRPLEPDTPRPQASARTPTVSAPSYLTLVNYEKIYLYLGTLHKPESEQCKLTPMESAIVLDLLMSLPEELLLLDCDKISQHLSQVYKSLSSRADSPEEVKTQNPSGAPDPQQPQPAQEHSSTQRSADTTHPPLNPFRIPINLLSRKTQRTAT